MKRIIFSLFAAMVLFGCEDVQDNSPAMQGTLDQEFFKATQAVATRITGSGGAYLIQGQTDNELLTLRVPGPQSGVYVIQDNPAVYASFQDFEGNVFLSDPNGEGQIEIERWDTSGRTLSGTFGFTAYSTALDTLIVQRGIFYNVPYTVGEDIDDPGAGAGTLLANLDGEDFTGDTVYARNNGSNVTIEGISSDGAVIEIRVPNDVTPGNYDTQESPFRARFRPAGGGNGDIETSLSGTIVVVIHDVDNKVLKGTFSFETANHVITLGQFNVTY